MFEGLGGGFTLLADPQVMIYIIIGIIVSTIVGVIPGLGGLFALALLLPFVFGMDPLVAIAVLVAASTVSGTGNTITSVLFGVPGSPGGVASIFDGYPMAQKGLGARAVAAGLGASAAGGIIGALVLAVLLPFLRPIVLALGPPEFFILILGALLMIAYVARGSSLKALVAAGAGLMLSFIGLEGSTGTQRYTFGSLYLWDGIPLVPMMIGLFAVAEMIKMVKEGTSISQVAPTTGNLRQVRDGLVDVLRHWKTTIQGGITGVWVGIAPGMGDAAAQFIAYAQAAKTSKRSEYFGTGEVEGVIAPDSATNAKEGGALIPTLAFGIPGSSSQAILLAAFITFGIQPGAQMLETGLEVIWFIILVLVLANILGVLFCLPLSALMAKFTTLRPALIVPPILLFSLFGSYISSNRLQDALVAFAFGVVGYGMSRLDYSRAALLIAYVLGALLERNYLLSVRLHGLGFIQRPITLGLIMGILFLFLVPYLKNLVRGIRRPRRNHTDN